MPTRRRPVSPREPLRETAPRPAASARSSPFVSAPKKKKRASGNPWLRLLAAAAGVFSVVFLSSSLTSFLQQPSPEAMAFASAEGNGLPTPEPTPSPVPTITPTPAVFAPFGAQYGYGDSSLIPATPVPEETASPALSAVPIAEATPEAYQTLKKGAEGDDVRRLQQALSGLGYLSDAPDGSFGGNTRAAVIQFQAVNGLTADGIAGQKTLTLLYEGKPLPASAAPASDFLILVNRQQPLGENYVPMHLVNIEGNIPSDLLKVKYKGTQADKTAVEALRAMMEGAAADGVTDWQISSAYRAYSEQQQLVDKSVKTYLRNHTDWTKKQALSATYNTVAPAGTSEHQTGLAFDVTVPGVSFTGTEQQKWLHKHCHEYGFIIRYTAEKQKITGFIAESWHIRYVGLEPAAIMTRNDWCLEEYLDHMKAR